MNLFEPDQKKAIEHDTGPCLILAGPGSGKTTVLTTRIRHLIKARGVPPESLMVITFTRAAAREMKERFYRMLYDEGDYSRPNVTFGTFHSIFLSIIRNHRDLSDLKILTGKSKLVFMKECAQSLSLLKDERDEAFDRLSGDISWLKNGGEIPKKPKCGLSEEEFKKYFNLYELRRERYGYLDFDDMLVVALNLFKNDRDCLLRLRERYLYFLVDEAQDMNLLQYEAVKYLAGERGNIFLVGDDDQSIYSFRGAEPRILRTFTKEYPACEVIEIHGNFRCASKIVDASSRLIAANKERFQKTLRSMTGKEGEVTLIMHADEDGQDRFAVRYIRKFLSKRALSGQALAEKDFAEKPLAERTIAILVRNRAEAYQVMDALKCAGIDFSSPFAESAGKGGALTDYIAEDVLAYMRLAVSKKEQGYKRTDILKIMNKPDRRLPRYGLESEEISGEEWKDFCAGDAALCGRIDVLLHELEALRGFSPKTALRYIMSAIGYKGVIEDFLKEHPLKRAEVEIILKELEVLSESARRKEDFISAIEDWQEEKKERAAKEGEEGKGARVFIYTYHGAKGLEFDEVILFSVNETIVPSKKALTNEAVEEERRMFYVAMTRAREKLTLSCVKKHGKDYLPPSRFLYEMKGK